MFTPDEDCCPHCGQRLGLEEALKEQLAWLLDKPGVAAAINEYFESIDENGLTLDEFLEMLDSEGQ